MNLFMGLAPNSAIYKVLLSVIRYAFTVDLNILGIKNWRFKGRGVKFTRNNFDEFCLRTLNNLNLGTWNDF